MQGKPQRTCIAEVPSPRKISKITIWHVWTQYEVVKTAQVASELRHYNITVLGLCDMRCTQPSQMKVTTVEVVFYSGHEEMMPQTP